MNFSSLNLLMLSFQLLENVNQSIPQSLRNLFITTKPLQNGPRPLDPTRSDPTQPWDPPALHSIIGPGPRPNCNGYSTKPVSQFLIATVPNGNTHKPNKLPLPFNYLFARFPFFFLQLKKKKSLK